jgi:AbrB family looped-hinge helix DNA binding protein
VATGCDRDRVPRALHEAIAELAPVPSSCDRLVFMGIATITRGGQISIPADVRHRWGTRRVVIEDQGDSLVLRPLRADPIGAAVGSLAGPGSTTDELRAALRRDDTQI